MSALLLLLALERPADACSCEPSGASFFPAHGAADVATSARPVILLPFNVPNPPTLVAADGSAVAVTIEEQIATVGERLLTLVPAEPLLPATTYQVIAGEYTAEFTTGSGADAAAPALPTLLSATGYATPEQEEVECGTFVGSSCGASAGAVLELAGDADPWRVEARATTDGGATGDVLRLDARLNVGHHLCSPSFPASMLDAQSVAIQWRALDASGNASEWSDPVTVDLPWPAALDCEEDTLDEGLGGCNAAAGFGGALSLLVAALGALRRRSARS